MQCPESVIGPHAYFALLAFVVGASLRLLKRIPFLSPDTLPILAFGIGWAIDAGVGNLACGQSYTEAAGFGLGGGFAGLAAAGGHEALMRGARVFGLEALAEKILGNASKKHEERSKKPPAAALLVLLVTLSGCGVGALQALATAAQGAQWLGTVIGVADAGADAYFARHPNLEAERQIEAAVRRARQALEALDAALAAGEAIGSEDVAQARLEAERAYSALYRLLADLGVLSARPPMGGAETDAPAPEPLHLPTPEEVGARL